ncbi:MAG: HAD-IA family hydrolase [Acidobacteria bacterium]|nr:HAD-IA family hydrolase [Acidobacteriota bacterium]
MSKIIKPPTIIFDLMDTIVIDPFYAMFPKYFNMTLEELYKIKNPNNWPKFEVSKISEKQYFEEFFLPNSGYKLEDPEKLKSAIFSSYYFIKGMEDFLFKLNSLGYPLWIHSNYSFWFEEVRKRLNLDRLFQGYSVSYKIGFRKPEHAAYLATLGLIKRKAQECIFIDDREINVIAACEVGLNAIHFISLEKLQKDLSFYLKNPKL